MIKMKVDLREFIGFEDQLEEAMAANKPKLREIAKVIEARAEAILKPRRVTGNLENSVRVRVSKFEDGGYLVIASGGGSFEGYHSWLVEYGHVKMLWGKVTGERVGPAPYMRPAVEEGFNHAVGLFRGANI